jgi:hypothetical protein
VNLFDAYIGIDYSGAGKPTDGLTGLRVFQCSPKTTPTEVRPPKGAPKHWSRKGLAQYLAVRLRDKSRVIVGIDHSFSFPAAYFDQYALPNSWHSFLNDFCAHWPADADLLKVEDIRQGRAGRGQERTGNSRWRRIAEVRCRAKSVFHFDVQGQVAKSTHAGLPWLRYLRDHAGEKTHFWPFDGWEPLPNRSVIAEVYPSMWKSHFSVPEGTPDQQDAYRIAAWLRSADANGTLTAFFHPPLTKTDHRVAAFEGWILGLTE